MLHKVEIFPVYDTLRTILKIDGTPIKARAYTLTQEAGNLPQINIEMPVMACVDDGRVVCVVENKDELAHAMDPDEFDEFCRIWHEKHDGDGTVSRLDKWGDEL